MIGSIPYLQNATSNGPDGLPIDIKGTLPSYRASHKDPPELAIQLRTQPQTIHRSCPHAVQTGIGCEGTLMCIHG